MASPSSTHDSRSLMTMVDMQQQQRGSPVSSNTITNNPSSSTMINLNNRTSQHSNYFETHPRKRSRSRSPHSPPPVAHSKFEENGGFFVKQEEDNDMVCAYDFLYIIAYNLRVTLGMIILVNCHITVDFLFWSLKYTKQCCCLFFFVLFFSNKLFGSFLLAFPSSLSNLNLV